MKFGGPIPRASASGNLGWGWGTCVFNKCLADWHASGQGTPL